ncbi:MAG: T9SS type A sorting domain-containing protein, partial [Saprospiraceae bacterium]
RSRECRHLPNCNTMCKLYLLCGALCLFVPRLQAQWPVIPSPSVVNAAGGTIMLAGGDFVEYSIGEPAIVSLNLNGNPLGCTQGFLQPRLEEPYIINTHESFDEQYGFQYYPNPVAGFLTVETGYPDFTTAQFSNVTGQIIQQIPFSYSPIDCAALPAGLYFVRLFSTQQPESKTFKLLKQ